MKILPFQNSLTLSPAYLRHLAPLVVSVALAAETVSAGTITGRLLVDGAPVTSFGQIAFQTPASPSRTWFGTAFESPEGIFRTENDLVTGNYESFTFGNTFIIPPYLAPHRTALSVISGQTTDIGNVAVIHADRAITGTVGGSSGDIPDLITIVSTATIAGVPYVVRSTPDQDRSFRLPAADGTWTVVASNFGTVLGETVVTVDGANVTNVQLGQPVAMGTITGRLVQNGQPVPFARFSVRNLGPGSFVFSTRAADENGRFNLALAAGNYELGTFISNSLGITNLVEWVPAFALAEGETRDLGDLRVLSDLFSVTGTVLDGTIPSIFAELTAVANVGGATFNVWSQTFFDASGSFALSLANAEWTITAEDFMGSSGAVTVNVSGGDVDGIAIAIESGPAPQNPYEEWATFYGLSGEDADLEADPDNDGYTNSQEFSFGTDPSIPTAELTTTTRSGNQFTVSWLQRDDGFLAYFVRQSSDLKRWEAATVDVQMGSASPAPPQGYVRKQFTVSASGQSFYRVLATDNPAAVPDESFTMTVSGAPVTVERWGSGPKALVFFGYIPFFLEEDLKAFDADQFATLVGEEYSMFLWTYPGEVSPFSDALDRFDQYDQNPTAAWAAPKVDFSGITSSVVSQIRAATGLTEICVVANSFGAGVVMWDFAALSADPSVRFVLISPTELFLPALASLPPANPLPRTVLLADAARDPFFNPANNDVRNYVSARSNVTPLPGFGHFIIGEDPISLDYVFSLIDLVYPQP